MFFSEVDCFYFNLEIIVLLCCSVACIHVLCDILTEFEAAKAVRLKYQCELNYSSICRINFHVVILC